MNTKANPIAAALRVLADQLETGADGWPYGDAEFGPMDELERVEWKFLADLRAEFGDVIVGHEPLLDGSTRENRYPIPRYVHLRQTCGKPGSYSQWCAANASFLAPYNASRLPSPNGEMTILPLTYSSWESDLAMEKRKLRQRCINLRDGNVFSGFSGVSSDPDPGAAR